MALSDNDAAHLELDLGALSDEALVKQTLPLASGLGCKLIACAVLASLCTALALGPRTGLLVLGLGLLMVGVARRLRGSSKLMQRARAAELEFRRRFGAEPLAERLPEARAQVERDSAIEMLGLFRGTVLPHGGLRFLRLEIKAGAQPKLLVCSTPALSELQRGVHGTLEMVHRERPLSAAQVQRLRGLVSELTSHPPAQLASFVKDGFPCEASLLARRDDELLELHASANLSGLPAQLARHPSIRLLELFLDFEAEVIADTRLG